MNSLIIKGLRAFYLPDSAKLGFCMHEYRRFIFKELVDPFIVLETCMNVSDDLALDSLKRIFLR